MPYKIHRSVGSITSEERGEESNLVRLAGEMRGGENRRRGVLERVGRETWFGVQMAQGSVSCRFGLKKICPGAKRLWLWREM